jgi:hypothetical protein
MTMPTRNDDDNDESDDNDNDDYDGDDDSTMIKDEGSKVGNDNDTQKL